MNDKQWENDALQDLEEALPRVRTEVVRKGSER